MATSGGGASEHTTGASEHISLDDAITKLKHHREADELATEILAAATTLRDSTGSDRKQSLRQMCGSTWGVSWSIKIDGKWKERPLHAVEKDLETAVCNAAVRWERQSRREEAAEGTPESNESGVNADPPAKKARRDGAPEHGVASSTAQPSTGKVQELPETPNDVDTWRRLGSDTFEATLRSGAVRRGDSELLRTLPQGEAKLATLAVREFVAASKAKAKAKVKAKPKDKAEEEGQPEEGIEAGSDAQRPNSLQQMFQSGASEHSKPVLHDTEGVNNDADREALAQPEPNKRRKMEDEAAKAGAELFPQNDGTDHDVIKWLQAQEAAGA